jgi:uncharacterized protein
MIPTLKEIEALHQKYAPHQEAYESVYTHCQIVAAIADDVMQRGTHGADRDLVIAGCLLHDIGVYALYTDGVLTESDYIRHGVLGEEILRQEGLPPHICRFCSHHTGVGLRKESIMARNLPLPHQDFVAETPEEELIMFADKFHSKLEPPTFNSVEFYTAYVGKFGSENSLKFAEMVTKFGAPDIGHFSAKYGQGIRTKID